MFHKRGTRDGTHLQKMWLQVMDTAELSRLKLPRPRNISANTQQIGSLKIYHWGMGNTRNVRKDLDEHREQSDTQTE